MIGDVVTLVSIVGEVVGRCKGETDSVITLENPRLFMQTQEGAGFAPGLCMTGVGDSIDFHKTSVLCAMKTSDEAAKAWQQVTSGIIL